MSSHNYHEPVLLQDCIKGLNLKSDGFYADVTFGGGGHSREIIKYLGENGRLFAFDQDTDAKKNLFDDPRLTFIPQNFRYIKNFLRLHGVKELDGILADLGVSSHQFDLGERGFSIRHEGSLDMRMDQSGTSTAELIINSFDENNLTEIFREYGELNESARISRKIIQFRNEKRISTTEELKNIVKTVMPPAEKESKFMAKVFQAIRIAVNDEMNSLKEFLNQCLEILKPGGRLVIISYHSLEDRQVKNLIRSGNTEGVIKKDFFGNIYRPFKQLTKKPIVPTNEEIQINNRARSAKLRIAEKN